MIKKIQKIPKINRSIARKIIILLEEFFGEKHDPLIGNKVSDWLYTTNPQLENIEPISYIMKDFDGKKIYKLFDFVYNMIDENKRSIDEKTETW